MSKPIPVQIIHENLYQMGRRLPHLDRIEIAKTPVVTRSVFSRDCRGILERPITVLENENNPFGLGHEHHRRYFFRSTVYSVYSKTVVCRWCGALAYSMTDRMEHIDTCYQKVNSALDRIGKDKECAVCRRKLEVPAYSGPFHGVPVCSKLCLDQWENCNPEVLKFIFGLMRMEEKKDKHVV